MPESEPRPVSYVDREAMERAIIAKYPPHTNSGLPLQSEGDSYDDYDSPAMALKRKPRFPKKGGDEYPD